jgi:glycosyltransferase involved in cell wall biosynthesis
MWPSESRPEHGVFIRDQVDALRRLGGLELEIRHFRPGISSYLSAALALRRSRDERFDVVHAHYGLSGWSALASGRGRLAVTFHGTDLRHRIVGPLSRTLSRLIRLPAATSASLARSGIRGAGNQRAVAVLPCGVDLERFKPVDRREARRRLGLDPGRPLLLFPSDPARRVKRHDRAARLAARLPEARLVTLTGVPPGEVPLWVNAANAVLVTSDDEGFGLAALEALACDVPVLSTPVGIAPVALLNLPGSLCAPYEEEPWLSVLRRHVEAADPRVEGRARAELFSSMRMAERVAAAYRELARPSPNEEASAGRPPSESSAPQSASAGHQRA